jgi:hypothetical protein
MDNSEFESRVFANPDDNDRDFLEALETDPLRRQLLDEVQSFNDDLTRITSSVAAPASLGDRLKSITMDDQSSAGTAASDDNVVNLPERGNAFRMLTVAAVLVLAVGVTYSSLFGGNQPTAQELAFGQQVVNHVYMELDEIDSRPGASFQQVTQVFGAVGATVAGPQVVNTLGISFAKPCAIIPQNSSAHLVMDGSAGAVNIIVINNSPVSQQFSFSDDRFETVVIPMEDGNLILVGEINETFNEVRRELDDLVTWVI